MTRILEQWHELTLHFGISGTQEKCLQAQHLSELFKDVQNLLYLQFLKPVLQEMQHVNKCFQSQNTDSSKLLNDLILAIRSLQKKIIPEEKKIDILFQNDFEKFVVKDLYLGYEFEKLIKNIRMDMTAESVIRECCTNFIIELVKQLKQRWV